MRAMLIASVIVGGEGKSLLGGVNKLADETYAIGSAPRSGDVIFLCADGLMQVILVVWTGMRGGKP